MTARWIIASVLCLACASPALAQDNAEENEAQAVMSAVAYGTIAPGAAFDTLAQENTELDATALERVNAALVKDGYTISREATMVMIVDMTLVRAEGQDTRTAVPRTGTEAPLGQGDNLFSTERSTLLNLRERPRSGHLLRLDISVYERKSGLYLWRGQIARDGLDIRIEQAEERMVAAMLEHLGKSVPETVIPLQ